MLSLSGSSRTLLLILAVGTSLTPLAFSQLETRGSFVTNNSPSSIAVGDFNHDGKLDVAVAAGASTTDTVAILLGNGDGTFRHALYYTVGVGAVSLVAADFNHDGNLDLAVASQSSYIGILLGNGDGTFQTATQRPPVPTFEQFVTVGDFNGDGKPDLVTLASGVISVLLGNGDGTFQDAVTTQPPFSIESIGAGDFNRDGKLDLATAGTFGSDSSVNILLGNGDGTFQNGATYPGGNVPVSIAVADFNGDHKLDLAIADSEGVGVSVLLGNGDGTFQTAVVYPIPFTLWVTAADLNGDGKLDLVVANNITASSGLTVFLGNGDGTFQSGTFYPAGIDASYAAVGDFNGDAKKDLVAADNRFNDVIVLLNTGTVAFSPTAPLNFKKQAVGTTSAPQKVTLTNTGKAALKISAMKAAGQFAMTSTCHASVAPGAKCSISVTFSPKSNGTKSGTVTILDSASSKPMVIELSGTGT
ncbi:MAG: FG-GAP-like repeat-containing protein [Candidatus Sulfotelmatobacter sp.]